MSNFPWSLTRNITSHSMENLDFPSLLKWKITLPNITTSLIHFLIEKVGRMYSLSLGVKRLNKKDREPDILTWEQWTLLPSCQWHGSCFESLPSVLQPLFALRRHQQVPRPCRYSTHSPTSLSLFRRIVIRCEIGSWHSSFSWKWENEATVEPRYVALGYLSLIISNLQYLKLFLNTPESAR